jgi:hypothetical protein
VIVWTRDVDALRWIIVSTTTLKVATSVDSIGLSLGNYIPELSQK